MPREDAYRDLRERHRRTVDELLKTQRMLQLVMDNIPQHIFWKDTRSVYLGCNSNFAQVAGLSSPSEIVGKTDYDLPWKKEETEFFRAVDRRVMDENRPELHVIEPQHQASGKQSWLDTNKVPLHGEDGEVIGVLGTFEDITERRQAEQELERYREHLEQLVEERTAQQLRLEKRVQRAQRLEGLGVLAAGVAHDFSNLLVGVIGNVDLALEELPAASASGDLLREALDSATRAGELCHQMLACSGQGHLELSPLDLGSVVRNFGQLLRSTIPRKIALDLEGMNQVELCLADESQIRQVLLSLVMNAAEAIGDGPGRIVVGLGVEDCDIRRLQRSFLGPTSQDSKSPSYQSPSRTSPDETHSPGQVGRYVSLAVRDDGCGMDAETREKIFDPFFSTKFTGRGLGLASVLGIVRGHGGLIEVESEPGEGTTFRLLFPVDPDAQPAQPSLRPTIEPVSSPLAGCRVLLVDDENVVRQVGRKILERAGCEVTTARDGQLAVELFAAKHHEIDCVVLDLTMPRMGGVEAFHRMRQIEPSTQVVLSTGYNVDRLPPELHHDDLVRVLGKPYPARHLVREVGRLFGSR